jgi:hypothetical protein
MQETSEPCPQCGTRRDGRARHCSYCSWDFDSLSHKYLGTEFATPDTVRYITATRPRSAPRVSLGVSLGVWTRMFAVYAVVVVSAIAILAGFKAGVIANNVITAEPIILASTLLIPWAASTISLAIPGRFARGFFKGYQLAFIGWLAVAVVGFVVFRWLPTSIWQTRGVVEQLLVALTGVSFLRLLLLLLG